MSYKQAIGERLKELLKERKITQSDFSKQCSISRITLNRIIKARNNVVTFESLLSICKALQISFRDFFDCDYFNDIFEKEAY